MAKTPESEKQANSQMKPCKLPSPKRGAFPTPKAEIERAKPYLPETDLAGHQSAMESVSPENTDQENTDPKEDNQSKLQNS
jgi:hypothetical protein